MPLLSKLNFNNVISDICDRFARKQLDNYTGTNRTATLDNDTVNVSGDHTLVAGDESRTADNITDHASNVFEISSPDLRLVSANRPRISKTEKGYRRTTVPLADQDGNPYNVLAESEDTDEILADKCIIVGDSYGTGLTPDGEVQGWPAWTAFRLGLDNNKFENLSLGGIGFTTNPSFLDRLKMSKFNKKEVSRIIVAGGYNDGTKDFETTWRGVTDFVRYATNNYPYAYVYVAMVGTSSDLNRTLSDNLFNTTLPAYQYGSTGLERAHFLLSPTWTLKDYSLMSRDTIHPTEPGYMYLGTAIADAIIGQGWEIGKLRAFDYSSLGGGILGCTIRDINVCRYMGNTYVIGGQIIITTVDFTWNGNDPLVVCTLKPNGYILGSQYDYVCGWPCIAYLSNQSGNYVSLNVRAYIVNGNFCIRNDNVEGRGFKNYEHVRDITLRFVTTAIPTAWC